MRRLLDHGHGDGRRDWTIIGLPLSVAAGFSQGFLAGAATLVGFAAGTFLGGRIGRPPLNGPRRPTRRCSPCSARWRAVCPRVDPGDARPRAAAQLCGSPRGSGSPTASAARRSRAPWRWAWRGWRATSCCSRPARAARDEVQRSSILAALNAAAAVGPILNALARFDPVPGSRPQADVPPPTAPIARDPQVEARAPASSRCSAPPAGSASRDRAGWRPTARGHQCPRRRRPDDTTAQLRGSDPSSRRAVAFDPRNDIAVLRVPGWAGGRSSWPQTPARHGGRDPRLPRERPVRHPRRAPRRDHAS